MKGIVKSMQLSRRTVAILSVPTVLVLAGAARAQFGPPQFLKAVPSAPRTVQAGKPFVVSVDVTIDSKYHIQGNPSKEGYIATELEVGPLKGFKANKVVYPKPIVTSFSGEKLPVYEGKVQIKADITADKTVKPGKYTLPVTLKYQGCDEQKCFPPATIAAKAVITVTPGAK